MCEHLLSGAFLVKACRRFHTTFAFARRRCRFTSQGRLPAALFFTIFLDIGFLGLAVHDVVTNADKAASIQSRHPNFSRGGPRARYNLLCQ